MDTPTASTSISANKTSPRAGVRPPFRKRRFIVDREAQYTYLVYVLLIGCLFTAFDIATSVLWHLMVGSIEVVTDIPRATLMATVLAIVCLGVFVISIAVVAANLVSNRLAGPVWRLNENMKRTLEGHPIQPLELREKDQFHNVAQNYNNLMLELKMLRETVVRKNHASPKGDGAQGPQ